MTAASPSPAPAASNGTPLRRSIWIGTGLIIAGLVIAIVGVGIGVWQISSLRHQQNRLVRVEVPTEQEIMLDKGTRDVWFEARSEVFVQPNEVALTIIDPTTDEELRIRTASSSTTFSSDGRFSRKVGVVTVPRSGTYLIAAEGPGAETIAFGNISIVAIAIGVGVIIGGVFLGGLMGLIGGIVLIVALIRRSNAKAQAA